jgi:hypothetical protein
MSAPKNPYAFPGGRSKFDGRTYPGMSLRDWFAGQALSGLMAHVRYSPRDAARQAYDIADAMLALSQERDTHE